MANSYDIRLYTPDGKTQLASVPPSRLEYVLVENDVGSLSLTIPPVVPFDAIPQDMRIEVWRSIDGGQPYCEGSGGDAAVWLVESKRKILSGSEKLISLTAVDAKDLLRRRFVDYYSGSSQSSKQFALDDMMKLIVVENLSNLTYGGVYATGRDLSTWLSIQAYTSQLPNKKKSFAWRNVLTVLQEICAQSAGEGKYAAFDLVRLTQTVMEFRTFYDVRGTYKGLGVSNGVPLGIVVSPETGSLTSPVLEYDWSDAANYVRVGGEGEGSARLTGQSIDPIQIAQSPFARRERFLDARNSGGDQAGLTTEAVMAVFANRPRLRFSGTIVDTASIKYGRHYRHGDIIGAQWEETALDVRVTKVKVALDSTGERIEAQFSNETILS